MRNVFLPADHSLDDLVLAGQVSDAFGSAELYVAWSSSGRASAPTIAAGLREPAPPAINVLAEVITGLTQLFTALLGSAHPAPRPGHAAS